MGDTALHFKYESDVSEVPDDAILAAGTGFLKLTTFMNTTAKIQQKGQVTIPTSVRRQAGLSKGDLYRAPIRKV
jgi:hypothetical protein